MAVAIITAVPARICQIFDVAKIRAARGARGAVAEFDAARAHDAAALGTSADAAAALHFQAGFLAQQIGRLGDALVRFEAALAIVPGHAQAARAAEEALGAARRAESSWSAALGCGSNQVCTVLGKELLRAIAYVV